MRLARRTIVLLAVKLLLLPAAAQALHGAGAERGGGAADHQRFSLIHAASSVMRLIGISPAQPIPERFRVRGFWPSTCDTKACAWYVRMKLSCSSNTAVWVTVTWLSPGTRIARSLRGPPR